MNNHFITVLILAVFAYCLVVYIIPYGRRMIRGKGVIFIEPKMLEQQLAQKKDILLIDIRSKAEFYNMFGHIDRAINLPYKDFMLRLAETADNLAGYKNTPVVLIGLRDEGMLYDAYDALMQKGFTNVAVLDKGISQWLRLGLPTVERNVKKI